MTEKIKLIYLALTAGDACGRLFDGMSRGHIASHFKTAELFPDSFDALKGREYDWKKPGLYGAISQLSILGSLINPESPADPAAFNSYVARKGKILEGETGVFRTPLQNFASYIISAVNGKDTAHTPMESSSMIPVICAHLFPFFAQSAPDSLQILSYARGLGVQQYSSAGSVILISVLYKSLFLEDADPLETALSDIEDIRSEFTSEPARYFDAGFNPDRLAETASHYLDIFTDLNKAKTIEAAEKVIIGKMNRFCKSPVARATLDHPCAIFPFSFACASRKIIRSGNIIRQSAAMGGSSSILTSLSAMIGSAFREDFQTDDFFTGIINRKNLTDFIGRALSLNSGAADADEFLEGEVLLTRKEMEERMSRCKSGPENVKKTANSLSQEQKLSRHVVESWTKTDKARWRREKRHNTTDNDEE